MIWALDFLFVGLGWAQIAARRRMGSLALPIVTLASVLAAGALRTDSYDRPIALCAMLDCMELVRGRPRLAQVWQRLQPWLAGSIVLATASLFGQRPGFVNIYSGWLVLLWPYGGMAIVVTGLCLTQSLSAIAGMALAWLSQYSRWLLIVGPLVLVAAIILRPISLTNRIGIWTEAVHLYLAHPLLGWGTGTYYLSTLGLVPDMLRSTAYQQAHNLFLTILVENGLPGAAALGWLLYRAGGRVRHSTSPARLGIMAMACQQLLDDTWLNPLSAILLGLQFGMLEAMEP